MASSASNLKIFILIDYQAQYILDFKVSENVFLIWLTVINGPSQEIQHISHNILATY